MLRTPMEISLSYWLFGGYPWIILCSFFFLVFFFGLFYFIVFLPPVVVYVFFCQVLAVLDPNKFNRGGVTDSKVPNCLI